MAEVGFSVKSFLLAVFLTVSSSVAIALVDKVTSTAVEPLQQLEEEFPENAYLDVGVVPLDPGLDLTDEDDTVLPEVRDAEAIYIANQLTKVIQQSGAWGAVRLIPNNKVIVDVYVEGKIIQSDGETFELDVRVSDTSGREWFEKNYRHMAGKYAYNRRLKQIGDPFQNIFNELANDMLDYRRKIDHKEATDLATISRLRFMREFAPDAFSKHIVENRKGILKISRLPAKDDPTLERVQRIRERDYLYIDTMQDYYDIFSQRMHVPYQTWRKESYDTVVKIRRLEKEATRKTVMGVVGVIAGIAGRVEGDSRLTRDAGTVTAAAGGLLIKSGLQTRAEAKAQIEVLSEMGASLQSEIEPQIIELEDRTVTLTGTVDAQYEQWKELLHKIYDAEYGTL